MSKSNDLETRTREVQDGLDARMLKLLEVLGHRRIGEIAAKIGRSRSHYSRSLVHNEYRFSNEDRIRTLIALGLEPEELYSGFFGFDLNLYLAELELREPGEVRKVEERLRRAKPASGSLDALRRLVAGLEERRLTRGSAAEGACYTAVCGSQKHDVAEWEGEAWGVLAALCRGKGKHSAAAYCLRKSLRLAKASGKTRTKAKCLQRASYLVADEGELQEALRLVNSAAGLYAEVSQLRGIGETLVEKAILYVKFGKLDRAHHLYKKSLRLLTDDSWHYRFSVFQGLGFLNNRAARLARASEYLDEAVAIQRSHPMAASKLRDSALWLRSEIAASQGKLDLAEKDLRLLLKWNLKNGSSVDIALVGLRLSRVLLLAGRPDALRKIADQLLPILSRSPKNKVVASAIREFVRAMLTGKLSVQLIDRLFSRVKSASKKGEALFI